MKLGKILVPLDGSALAEAALWKAVELGTTDTMLVLLRAAEAYRMPGGDPIQAQITAVREAEEYLAAVAAKAEEAGIEHVETHVWYGPPAAAVVEAAQAREVDLIVMSSHGRSGLGRLILGSVTESVLRGTRTPILVLRPDGAPLEPPSDTPRSAEPSRV
jgi:nucleotide-binding universal stress UspA family protein